MSRDFMNYGDMVERALRGVVREAIEGVEREGLQGDHHFYISFRTDHPDVEISDALRAQHPEEMTIVLEHQFWGLETEEHAFAVTLSFKGVQERLFVPYEAMTTFTDPGVQFGLQFAAQDSGDEGGEPAEKAEPALEPAPDAAAGADEAEAGSADVVTLDAFRTKK